MKYIDEFRDGELARGLIQQIKALTQPEHSYRLMEFCGGHTHAIHRYGIPSLLPDSIELIHGPGCPVCVLPIKRIDQAISLANQPDVIFCSYGDMLRVPGSKQHSLLKAKAQGADVRMMYSIDDALELAKAHPNKKIIFFAIGFETTTPPTAAAIIKAKKLKLKNFFVFCNHVLTPAALTCLMTQTPAPKIDGFIGPAHVSVIIGSQAYESIGERFKKPIVISGFEPLDLLHSILLLIQQLNNKTHQVINQYTRAVDQTGNQLSQQLTAEMFTIREHFEWRGLGDIPQSALAIHPNYVAFDAEKQFQLIESTGQEHKACACGEILRGLKNPRDCKVFSTVCTPENPLGACMVSSEGACAAYYAYGRLNHA